MSPIEWHFWDWFFYLCHHVEFVIDPIAHQLPIGVIVFNTFAFFLVVAALLFGIPAGVVAGGATKVFIRKWSIANTALAAVGLAGLLFDLRLRWVTGVFSNWQLALGAYGLTPITANPWFATNTGGTIAFVPLWIFGALTLWFAARPGGRDFSERLGDAVTAPVYVTLAVVVGAAAILLIAGIRRLGEITLTKPLGSPFPIINGFAELTLAAFAAYAAGRWLFPKTTSRITLHLGTRGLILLVVIVDFVIRLTVAKGTSDLWRRLTYPGAGGEIVFVPLWAVGVGTILVITIYAHRRGTQEQKRPRRPPERIKL